VRQERAKRLKDIIQVTFGNALRKYRLQQKLSQESLAELANLDRTYISQIERGLKSPSIRTLIALSQALRVHAYLLIAEVEKELTKFSMQDGGQNENRSSGTTP
jgi:transcriptional regulator with XRE-family HTH domain